MEWSIIFFIVWLIFAIIISYFTIIRGKKALSIFPEIRNEKVIYRDKKASGYSTKSWKTKIGGANRSIDVVVTNVELWLRSNLFFAGILKQYDLVHRISLKNVTRVNKNGRKLTLDFINDNDESKQVVILTKDPDAFINALKGN
ncbi:MAG: hypothetical protein DRI54_09205 [Bacteroidetes bacterium]|nr:MAG: hypothetical protein DRI54_09205 [Bacteroidota bacterium]